MPQGCFAHAACAVDDNIGFHIRMFIEFNLLSWSRIHASLAQAGSFAEYAPILLRILTIFWSSYLRCAAVQLLIRAVIVPSSLINVRILGGLNFRIANCFASFFQLSLNSNTCFILKPKQSPVTAVSSGL